MEGSLFQVISPLIHQKYNKNITEDFKLPSPAPNPKPIANSNELYGYGVVVPMNGNIVPYFDKETFVFLYADAKTKAVTYDITTGIHKRIMGSLTPNSHLDRVLHGHLYTWTENSSRFFLFLKPVEISKKCFNII